MARNSRAGVQARKRGADRGLAAEMHRRRAALHGEFDRVAGFHRELHLVQVGHLADRGGDDRAGEAPPARALANSLSTSRGLAGEGGVDHAIERQVEASDTTAITSASSTRSRPCA